MFDALKAYASLIKLVLVGALCLGVLVFYEGIPWILDGRVDTARKDGAAAETLIWTTKMAELRAAGEKRRIEDQVKLDAIEADYLAEKKLKTKALSDLAAARKASPTKDNIAIPRALGQELNKVGKKP